MFLYIVVWIYLEDRVISYSHKELSRWDIKIANARYLYGGSELANAGIDWSKDWTFIGNANSDLENDEYASRLMYMYNKSLDKDNANTDIKENISKPLFTKVHLSNEITADNTTKF